MAGARERSVVFLHAHPDDEAIFTGGTIVKLAAADWRVVLVVATGGELGIPAAAGTEEVERVRQRRMAETRSAAQILGIARVEFLGYRDSGMAGDPGNTHPRALATAPVDEVAAAVAAVAAGEGAAALVGYDEHGIYGHPDHIKVHEAAAAAARQAGVEVLYEATVDREYLHFVETHLVVEAGGQRGDAELGLAASPLGVPTVAVSTMVDVRDVLEVKRRAMTAHGSQIPETASAMQLPTEAFSAVYGYEWYVRNGVSGPLETL